MRVVIVGGGQAGGWAAQTLRECGFDGEVVLLGEELHPPYQRPPLSKDVLLGTMEPDGCYLWPNGLDIDVRYGSPVTRIDRGTRTLDLMDDESITYDRLVLATGGRIKRLEMRDVHYLRTIDDAMHLRHSLASVQDVLVVGGGWIGLEAASVARRMGKNVTLVEAADRLCSRVMPPSVSEYLRQLHERNGVRIVFGGDANTLKGDIVIAGIGIIPNVELAVNAGLKVKDGIVVDQYCRTSDPNIFAIGDVANMDGIRIESWANAQNQGIAVGKTIAGVATRYTDIPWFWSDQYDVNLQFLGVPDPGLNTVMRGSPERDCFTLFFLAEDGRIAGAVAANAMRDLRAAKRIMERGLIVPPAQLGDESQPLKQLIAAAA